MEGNGQCEVGAFVIQPSMFHLKPNENVTILVRSILVNKLQRSLKKLLGVQLQSLFLQNHIIANKGEKYIMKTRHGRKREMHTVATVAHNKYCENL